jgi:amino acid adenylation domain-containing protein
MRLHQLVSDSAARTPQAPAIVGPAGKLTYGQLDTLANQYAAALHTNGVAPGERVVIWSGKSLHAVALMQAALRLGALYVPITSVNPPARVARIARDCAATLVVTEPDLAAGAPAVREQAGIPAVITVELLEQARTSLWRAPYDSKPDDPAYILYTSGSTGDPKGVCLSHRNALAFVEWSGDLLQVRAADRLANHAPFNFDLSVFDLYASFRAGASVHLIPPELSYAPTELVRFLREQHISIWYSVPSVLTLMMHEGGLLDGEPPPALRACIFAGEPFPITHVQELRKAWSGIRLLNWYGPTETNVCTCYEVNDADLSRSTPLPIGTACCGDTVNLDPPGKEGEIVVTGPTVMLGYWGKPRHEGPYRTGDIGRVDASGNLGYVGRRDHMVKVRGNRIELGEIEAAISTLPAVADVAVLVKGSGLTARLQAVVVPVRGATVNLLDVKRCCAERLPTYMIVDELRVVESLPLTANGKKDRTALAAAVERRPL